METIHIALCEDDPACRFQATELVKKWLHSRPALQAEVTAFDSGQALLDAMDQGQHFRIYLLDVLMPGPNGIQTGALLRQRSETGEIIYLSSIPDFAVDSYNVGAFFYLLKPVQEEKLFSVLDRAAARMDLRRGTGIIVPTSQGNRRVLLDDILYVEYASRRARYVCVAETVESLSLQNSFRETLAPLLTDSRFCLCGASYALNLQRVRMVNGQTATLTGGKHVLLPRTGCVEFKRLWGEYWLKEGMG